MPVSQVVLSARLAQVARFVPAGSHPVDVGTDHALLPISLVRSGQVPCAIACDVAPGPVRAAKQNVARFGLNHAISVRQGDGLAPVTPGEADVAVISGLGGWTVVGILHRAPGVLAAMQRVVVQPMNASGEVRRFMRRHGFGIWDEVLLEEDGRFYQIIAFDRAVCPDAGYLAWRPEEDWLCHEYGPYLLRRRSPATVRCVQEDRGRLMRVLKRVAEGTSHEAKVRSSAVEEQIRAMDRWLAQKGDDEDAPSVYGARRDRHHESDRAT
ncbi:MAG: class I SAM-dependent methyltransferase [Alicyclobacillus macrosporangiidus]|uniref:tRNA (adenine(22)-N(1))-methyltransferase n=1 Tax=Alicyclobacillus macrosporangiidus TaxID=392015 RepID=UPI0026F1D223|nr:class I SAM-dependent methyltransferase [Alicyclobacillus macrosporangiidus]MCL6600463.1 class I SAM-dependent methyltransferase [Alicyclobacillus macrosporangiidus]